ncbi:hypothetical protein HQ520_17050 [bacterium]|nr:hypothetical protein [bacterium]
MGLRIDQNTLRVSHTPVFGILMWLLTGVGAIVAGVYLEQKGEPITRAFIAVGVLSVFGALFLRKTVLLFDTAAGRLDKYTASWLGFRKRHEYSALDRIQAIVYHREVAHATSNRKGLRQEFSLLARTKENETFNFFPRTHTPLKAAALGKQIAEFIGVEFVEDETQRDSSILQGPGAKA